MLRSLLKKYPLLFILGLAFIIRIIYFICIIIRNPEGIYVFDSYGYWQIAYNVREYGIFSQSYDLPIEPDYFRTPIYPLFIILAEAIGPEGFSIIALQIILALLTCYYTYKIAMEVTSSSFIANAAALIIAIDVPSIVMNMLVLTETLFTFLLILGVFVFIKYLKTEKTKFLIMTALSCGLMILCRPIGFFIPFLFSLFAFYTKRKELKKAFSHLVIFGLITFLTITPWLIRNKTAFGHYFLSVIREHDMQNYQAAAIYAEVNHRSLPESQSILRWKTFKGFKGNANNQPYEYARYIEDDAIKIAFANPQILIKNHLVQFMHFFLKPCRAYIDIQLGHWGIGYNTIPKDYPIFKYLFEHNSKLTISIVFFQLAILLIIYLSFFFGISYFKQNGNLFFLFLLVSLIFCFANLTLPYVTESRFRVPVMPYIAIISSSGIYYLKEWFRRKKSMKK
jgi:4-amino-4-deoxy-L-arabinose transferase-like glycosyltransferase